MYLLNIPDTDISTQLKTELTELLNKASNKPTSAITKELKQLAKEGYIYKDGSYGLPIEKLAPVNDKYYQNIFKKLNKLISD